MAARRPKLDQTLYGPRDVKCTRTKPGVDVNQEWDIADIGDAADIGQHILKAHDPEIRQAQRACGDTTTRQVDCAIAGTFRQERMIRVNRTDNLERNLLGECLAEPSAAGMYGCVHRSPSAYALVNRRTSWPASGSFS